MPAPPAARVAIVEDDPTFVAELRAAIEGVADMVLAATAHNLAQARELLQGEAPDVLLVDLGLPDGSGIEVISEAHCRWPDCAIMVSTTFADETHVIQSIEAGASGYLLKDSTPARLLADIRSLIAGGSPISPNIARHILQRFRHAPDVAPPPSVPELPPTTLSPREREVLSFITKGFTYDEIAGMLGISRNTVMTFVRRIYAKLEVTSKVEALREAQHLKLLDH